MSLSGLDRRANYLVVDALQYAGTADVVVADRHEHLVVAGLVATPTDDLLGLVFTRGGGVRLGGWLRSGLAHRRFRQLTCQSTCHSPVGWLASS
jgi:hypothetical protein